MKDYFKDFEYFGFNSELEMAREIVDWASNSKNPQEKTMEELINEWIDNNSDSLGKLRNHKSKVSA